MSAPELTAHSGLTVDVDSPRPLTVRVHVGGSGVPADTNDDDDADVPLRIDDDREHEGATPDFHSPALDPDIKITAADDDGETDADDADADALAPVAIELTPLEPLEGATQVDVIAVVPGTEKNSGPVSSNPQPIAPATTAAAASSSPAVAAPKLDLPAALEILNTGAAFERFTSASTLAESASASAAAPSTLVSVPTFLFVAPLLTAAADANGPATQLGLYWCAASEAQDRPRLESQCMHLSAIRDLYKGALSVDLRAAMSAPAANSRPVLDEECMVLRSRIHLLSLQAANGTVRDRWVEALCTVLEAALHKQRVVETNSAIAAAPAPARQISSRPSNANRAPQSPAAALLIGATSTQAAAAAAAAAEPPSVAVKALATEKAHLIHDIQLTLMEMVHASATLLSTRFAGPDGRPTAQASRAEFDLELKRESSDFQHVPAASLSANDKFEAKAYAPTIFARLRQQWGVTPAAFLQSVAHPTKGYNDLIVNSKSGSFFFYTHDNRYLLKSCSPDENRALCRHMLPSYYDHMRQSPDTLISRILGSWRLAMKKPIRQTVHFFLMCNVFAAPLHTPLHVRFDLKGSTYGRQAKEQEKEQRVPVLKDRDFFEGCAFPDGRRLPPTYLNLGRKKQALLRQLGADTEFLRSNGIMDYSLLVGIHYSGEGDEQQSSSTQRPDGRETRSPQPTSSPSSAVVANGTANGAAAASSQADDVDSSAVGAQGASSSDRQTNYGMKPQKEVLIPRQMLRRATMELLSAEQKQAIHDAANNAAASRPLGHSPSSSALLNGANHPAASSSPAAPLPSRPSSASVANGRRSSLSRAPLFEADGTIRSEDGTETYYLGVIDILQQYTRFKALEHTIKAAALSAEAVSCTDPYAYQQRFLRKLGSHMRGNDDPDPMLFDTAASPSP